MAGPRESGFFVLLSPVVAAQPAPPLSLGGLPPVHERVFGPSSRPTFVGVSTDTVQFAGAKRKLMSYNLDGLNNLAQKAEVILREDPDVVAVQEVARPGFAARFNRQFLKNRYPHYVVSDSPSDPKRRVGFLCKENIKIVDVKPHWNEHLGQDAKGQRDFLEVTVETETGYRMTLFNAHFRSMVKGESETLGVRMDEARSASRIVDRFLKQHPDRPVLVMGDLNSRADTSAGQSVLNTLRRVSQGSPNSDLFEATTPTRQADHRLPPSFFKPGIGRSRLDYIFCTRKLKDQVRDGYVAGDFKADPWRKASRHLPLVVVVEEPDPPAPSADVNRCPSPRFSGVQAHPRSQWVA